jgi:hypothetical protein
MGFKNNIRHMAAVVGNTLRKDVPETSSSLSGLAQAEWSRFPVGLFPSHPQEIEDYVSKPFPLGIPKGKSHMGVSTEREACTERSLSFYHRTTVLTIRFNNKAPMFTGPTHCGY